MKHLNNFVVPLKFLSLHFAFLITISFLFGVSEIISALFHVIAHSNQTPILLFLSALGKIKPLLIFV